MTDRDPTKGAFSGEIPPGEAADVRDDLDPRTERNEPVTKAMRVDAREARRRSQERSGKHRK